MSNSEIQRQVGWGFMLTAIISFLMPIQFACGIVAMGFWVFSWDNAKEDALQRDSKGKEVGFLKKS